MDVRDRVEAYLAGLPEPKQAEADLRRLHALVGAEFAGRLWSTGGRNEAGRVVANPNIGCGENTTRYADGSSRVFYRIGLSATTSGISVYLLGLDDDKAFLARTYGPSIGRATSRATASGSGGSPTSTWTLSWRRCGTRWRPRRPTENGTERVSPCARPRRGSRSRS